MAGRVECGGGPNAAPVLGAANVFQVDDANVLLDLGDEPLVGSSIASHWGFGIKTGAAGVLAAFWVRRRKPAKLTSR